MANDLKTKGESKTKSDTSNGLEAIMAMDLLHQGGKRIRRNADGSLMTPSTPTGLDYLEAYGPNRDSVKARQNALYYATRPRLNEPSRTAEEAEANRMLREIANPAPKIIQSKGVNVALKNGQPVGFATVPGGEKLPSGPFQPKAVFEPGFEPLTGDPMTSGERGKLQQNISDALKFALTDGTKPNLLPKFEVLNGPNENQVSSLPPTQNVNGALSSLLLGDRGSGNRFDKEYQQLNTLQQGVEQTGIGMLNSIADLLSSPQQAGQDTAKWLGSLDNRALDWLDSMVSPETSQAQSVEEASKNFTPRGFKSPMDAGVEMFGQPSLWQNLQSQVSQLPEWMVGPHKTGQNPIDWLGSKLALPLSAAEQGRNQVNQLGNLFDQKVNSATDSAVGGANSLLDMLAGLFEEGSTQVKQVGNLFDQKVNSGMDELKKYLKYTFAIP